MKHNYNTVGMFSLEGDMILDGVDYIKLEYQTWVGEIETTEAMAFRLDGVVYAALEDPGDGYRSAMKDLITGDFNIKNTFPPVRVRVESGNYENDEANFDEYSSAELLTITDAETGEIVIEVGTNYSDEYYPCFIEYWNPTGLVHNQ